MHVTPLVNKYVGKHPLGDRARKIDQGVLIVSSEYIVVNGARKKVETWEPEDTETIQLKDEEEAKKLVDNAFYKLEQTEEKKNLESIKRADDEIRDRNSLSISLLPESSDDIVEAKTTEFSDIIKNDILIVKRKDFKETKESEKLENKNTIPISLVSAEYEVKDADGDIDMLLKSQRQKFETKVVTPGEVISKDTQYMRGHGTYLDENEAHLASVAGVVERVNKLITVSNKRWKVDINSRQDAVLLLSAIHLPGVQLRNGSFLIVPPTLVQRTKSHFHELKCGVDVTLGLNGYVWVSKPSSRPIGKNAREAIARVCNCINALSKNYMSITDTTISYAYEASLNFSVKEILKLESMELIAEQTKRRLKA
ncbi:6191_t:CDS:10 [Diversispora eburnea]|uniref:6191_t:CDS:1 n=1 Tax=Diversispora eburnea TaxID=1213867 RepID=A0A9N8ZNP9_9GLOM|nr:6191_t:CDS:10 [Diversispora eburnea]